MSEKIVGLHFGPKDDPVKHDLLLARAYAGIINGINNRGLEVAVTRGADHFAFDRGVVDEIWLPEMHGGTLASTTRKIGGTSLDVFGAIRDLGKVLRPTYPYAIPLLNEPVVIGYDSKVKSSNDLLLGMQTRTLDLRDGSSLIGELGGDRVVIKPDMATGGRGVEITSKKEVRAIMERNPDVHYVGQEYIDMTAAFPEEIKGIDEDEKETLKALSARRKEMRIFGFYGPDQFRTVPVARIMKEGDETSDTWLFIDPDTIPVELTEKSKIVFDRLNHQTQVAELYGAVDYIWGSTHSEPDKHWMIGEVNLWRPVVPRRRNREIAQRYDDAMAEQLVRMTKLKGGKK